MPADWQPYRYGHWEHVAPWGQTWVDDQPWGFAPFHYGRWAHIGNRWGWVPGQYAPHPVYAPALVAFVGGGGFSASISFHGGDAVGWVPLAPGEGYRPPYRASPTYIQNINRTVIVNNVTINNNYGPGGPGPRGFGANAQPQTMAGFANRRFATVVPANVVGSARPVAAAAVVVHTPSSSSERRSMSRRSGRSGRYPSPTGRWPVPGRSRGRKIRARPSMSGLPFPRLPAEGRGADQITPNGPQGNGPHAAPAAPGMRPVQPPAGPKRAASRRARSAGRRPRQSPT